MERGDNEHALPEKEESQLGQRETHLFFDDFFRRPSLFALLDPPRERFGRIERDTGAFDDRPAGVSPFCSAFVSGGCADLASRTHGKERKHARSPIDRFQAPIPRFRFPARSKDEVAVLLVLADGFARAGKRAVVLAAPDQFRATLLLSSSAGWGTSRSRRSMLLVVLVREGESRIGPARCCGGFPIEGARSLLVLLCRRWPCRESVSLWWDLNGLFRRSWDGDGMIVRIRVGGRSRCGVALRHIVNRLTVRWPWRSLRVLVVGILRSLRDVRRLLETRVWREVRMKCRIVVRVGIAVTHSRKGVGDRACEMSIRRRRRGRRGRGGCGGRALYEGRSTARWLVVGVAHRSPYALPSTLSSRTVELSWMRRSEAVQVVSSNVDHSLRRKPRC